MADTVRNGANSSAGTSLTDGADNATLLVTADGFFSTVSKAVELTGLNSKATIGGLIESSGAGTSFTGGPNAYLNILSTGTISGATALKLAGGGNFFNYGHIFGATTFGNGLSQLDNHGLMKGAVTSTGDLHLTNSGQILGSVTSTGGADAIVNSGTMGSFTSSGRYGHTDFDNDGIVRGNLKFGDAGSDIGNGLHGTIYGNVTSGSATESAGNDGTITGSVDLGLHGALQNSGLIRGSVSVTVNDMGFALIRNEGGTIGGNVVFRGSGSSGGTLLNEGSIRGDVIGSAAADDMTSSGTIGGRTTLNAGNDRFFGGAGRDVVWGGKGNDTISGGGGDDTLSGDAGRDTLSGGIGRDTLKGGADADTFVYRSVEDSTAEKPGRDVILGFQHLADKIDLSQIDAVEASNTDNAFAFLGVAKFNGHAGQLRAELIGGTTILSGDVDGDAIADFAIGLKGAPTLTTADLVL